MDGLDVCKEIVEKFDIPIIISSARSDITDKVTALKLELMIIYQNLMIQERLEVRIRTILRRFNKSIEKDEPNVKKIFVLDENKKILQKMEFL